MRHALRMTASIATTITVIDFRRLSLLLEWNAVSGTWTACDVPPALVHGIALIRASQPNICIYGQGGALHLQIGSERFALAENSPRIRCTRGFASFGLRKKFAVESSNGEVLFSHSFWAGQGDDFFRWLAKHAADPKWRAATGPSWSEGVDPATLRAH
jgi:hypothetical protein